MLPKLLIFLLIFANQVKWIFGGFRSSEEYYQESSLSDEPKIYYLSLVTNITNRYATTEVVCRIKNPSVVNKEATFQMTIPEKAFISNFVMEINNRSYQSFVQEKEEAQKTYDFAVEGGQGAAQVKVSTRNSKRFNVNVNLEAEEKASFHLKYEELLEKNQDHYEVVMNIHPGQLVKNLQIEMVLNEEQGFKFLSHPKIRRGNKLNAKTIETNAKLEEMGKTIRIVKFNPDADEQKNIAKQMETTLEAGISGQLILTYDVEKKPRGGLIIQNKNYFAHYYTPNEAVLPKYIIFILDTSGSMSGEKLKHLKFAMSNILASLKTGDLFNIVEFSSTTKVWDVMRGEVTYLEGEDEFFEEYTDEEKIERNVLPKAHIVNETTIEKAKSILKLFEAIGGTDIGTAFKVGLELLNQNLRDKNYQPLILFSTDGDITNGELDYNTILKTVTETNKDRASIFTLSIGTEANRDFLKKLALKNKGKTGHIYEDDDIAQQFEHFFKKFSNPVLKNLTIDYGSDVKNVTNTNYNTVFDGSEIVIVGRKSEEKNFEKVEMLGQSLDGPIKIQPMIKNVENTDMKRLWAYLRVKQLLKQRKISENNAALTQRALRLALKYTFVTELTSLVVVKPDETKILELEDAFIEKGQSRVNIVNIPTSAADERSDQKPITNEIKTLISQLPWLQNLLLENGFVITPQGPIQLNLDKNFNTFPCKFMIGSENITGECKRLTECTGGLRNFDDFLIRSCKMTTKLTGICCDLIAQ